MDIDIFWINENIMVKNILWIDKYTRNIFMSWHILTIGLPPNWPAISGI